MLARWEVFTARLSVLVVIVIVYLGYLYSACTCHSETPTVPSPCNHFTQQQRWGGVDKRKKRPRVSSRDEASIDGMEDDSDQPSEAEPKVTSTSRLPVRKLLLLSCPDWMCGLANNVFCRDCFLSGSIVYSRAYRYLHAVMKVLDVAVYFTVPPSMPRALIFLALL